ncbi:hypothetical protein M446_6879 [Methylobacterium sp. 4-46]|uniref:hypothetical protein n=1 Tax=Methylobacterium sp. CB376 TaxID=3138063 RepID=UPI000152E96A|nr:hypothetical protein [Methylobacterium nodulans]ACA21122.1 hypothetical protein M446_6879 [Methylobacterium sp. 4-46]WFT80266.1 hypothetical protein QA634_34725 [Methylobacterium nodulans]
MTRRHPRRAYDEQGREIPPPKLADLRAEGEAAMFWSNVSTGEKLSPQKDELRRAGMGQGIYRAEATLHERIWLVGVQKSKGDPLDLFDPQRARQLADVVERHGDMASAALVRGAADTADRRNRGEE